MSKKSLQKQKIKMAMSLKGKNTHWKWAEIQPRHFLSTAKSIGYSATQAQLHIYEMFNKIEPAILAVEKRIPKSFPEYIQQSIFAGIRERAAAFTIKE